MILTRIDALDDFLGGSLPGGTILDIYGPGGSGKTQVLFQVAAAAAEAGDRVAYVDTTGAFRPERVLQMCRSPGTAILKRIDVLRATSVLEQEESLRRIDGGASVLLVDNVTDLFMYEYPGERMAFARGHRLMMHVRELSRLALSREIPVVVSNMIRQVSDREVESMGHVTDLFTHIKMRLSGRPEYTAWCQHPAAKVQFGYSLDTSGVRSRQDGGGSYAAPTGPKAGEQAPALP